MKSAAVINESIIREIAPILGDMATRDLLASGYIRKVCQLERMWADLLALSALADHPENHEELPRCKLLRQAAQELIQNPQDWRGHDYL